VLGDCEHALSDYAASANTPFQHTRWLSLITLLRTVGHVLEKVVGRDPTTPPDVKKRLGDAWEQLKADKTQPHIFHHFIYAERNDAVHQYKIGAAVNVTIQLGGVSTGGVSSPSGPARYDFVMRDGHFKGRDPRELAREAISFWQVYLDSIDSGGS
jgi:hypothetical protein